MGSIRRCSSQPGFDSFRRIAGLCCWKGCRLDLVKAFCRDMGQKAFEGFRSNRPNKLHLIADAGFSKLHDGQLPNLLLILDSPNQQRAVASVPLRRGWHDRSQQ